MTNDDLRWGALLMVSEAPTPRDALLAADRGIELGWIKPAEIWQAHPRVWLEGVFRQRAAEMLAYSRRPRPQHSAVTYTIEGSKPEPRRPFLELD